CFVSALTDFIPAMHPTAVGAMTLYWLPVCPWKAQVAPLIWPHSLPSCGGNPPRTAAADMVEKTSGPTSMRGARRLTRLNHCVLFIVELLPVECCGVAAATS